MDGYTAYRYYQAIKLHFSKEDFNVFKNRGHIKISKAKFESRNDHYLFEKVARKYNDKDFIHYVAANFMYGNPNVIYSEDAEANYTTYIKRKQSITQVFYDDCNTIINECLALGQKNIYSGPNIPIVVQLYIAKRITIETLSILEDLDDYIRVLKENPAVNLLWNQELLRIQKCKGFVKYDAAKIMPAYLELKEETNF